METTQHRLRIDRMIVISEIDETILNLLPHPVHIAIRNSEKLHETAMRSFKIILLSFVRII